ncbi:MAG: hypothetical protein CMG44_03725 [Candidatus Marinimicrobia bacterium]|nr:hypothetical protein [Candidatus Neomarinimicrobiota bacterium]
MISKKQIYSSIFLLKSLIVYLIMIFSFIIAQENLEQINGSDSESVVMNDSLKIKAPPAVNIIEERFTINGKAAYGNGVMVPDAEVMLLDTLEKTLQTTRTTTKLFGRFFGGSFKFENILPGEYIISVDLGTKVGIKKRIHLKNKNLDLGVVKNEVEFPKYEIDDYTDSTRIYYERLITDPVEPDSINVRHIVIELDGSARTVLIDSMLRDSVFYTLSGELTRDSIPLDDTYAIYNDYGYFIHQSRSFRDRINEVQKRDGYIIFHSGDTLNFDNIFFEPSFKSPDVATFHYDDTTGLPRFHSVYDIYKVHTGPSYVERSIERGFYTGIVFHGATMGFQILRKKSFKPPLSYLPNFSKPENKTNSYYSMITSFSFFTLGWVGYDWYMDRRSNYFTPKDELSPFPKNMFVFSAREWVFNQAQPFIDPIYETKVWKWWQDRNKRKDERKRAKRKSVFD